MLPSSYYNKEKADHAVNFINQLCHTKSEWAGKPFSMMGWQEQIVRDIFGIVDRADGTRQFRMGFVEIPKKQGKSELAAAIALYLLCADQEFGAEIYGCANDRNQASIVFNVARDMVLLNPSLRKMCKITDAQKRIVFLPTRSFYTAISSEVRNKYGLNVHGCIFDELLGQTDRQLFDVMTRGATVSRREPLSFVITTAGYDRTSICWEMHTLALDILEGRKIDGTFYPVVYSTPMEEDWTDPAVWEKCNPSLGVTVSMKNMIIECDAAKRDPALEMKFRRDFLCQWTSSETKWLPMDKYDKGAEPFDPMDLAGRKCYGGLDLASTNDIAAFVLVFPPTDDDPQYYILPKFWIPMEQMHERVRDHHVPYDKWWRQGFLSATDGRIIYYDFIEAEINKLGEIYDIREVAFDEWGALQMAQNLMGQNFEMVKTRQGFKSLSPPAKEFMRIVLDEKVQHGGNPVLRWMFENVYIETDAAGNIKPTKKKSREKIDGVIGTLMALERAIRQEDKGKGGIVVYDYDTDTATRDGEVISAPDKKSETSEERMRRIERETLFGYDL